MATAGGFIDLGNSQLLVLDTTGFPYAIMNKQGATFLGSGSIPPGSVQVAANPITGEIEQPAVALVGQWVPRTNTLAALLAIVGNQGELASATDTPAVVQFIDGSTAGGPVFMPYCSVQSVTITGSTATIQPWADIAEITLSTTSTAITLANPASGTPAGIEIALEFVSVIGGVTSLTVNGGSNLATVLPFGTFVGTGDSPWGILYKWTGSIWTPIKTYVKAVSVGQSKAVAQLGANVADYGSAYKDGDFADGGGIASGNYATAFQGKSFGFYSVAFGNSSIGSGVRAVAVGPGSTAYGDASMAFGVGSAALSGNTAGYGLFPGIAFSTGSNTSAAQATGAGSIALGTGCTAGTGLIQLTGTLTASLSGTSGTITAAGVNLTSSVEVGHTLVVVPPNSSYSLAAPPIPAVNVTVTAVSYSAPNTTITVTVNSLSPPTISGSVAVYNSSPGTFGTALGQYAVAQTQGLMAKANTYNVTPGDIQRSELSLYAQTTTNSAVTMGALVSPPNTNKVQGASSRFILDANKAYSITLKILAKQVSSGNCFTAVRTFLAVNNGGAVSISALNTIGSDMYIGWSAANLTFAGNVAVAANATYGSVDVAVTGIAATAINWQAEFQMAEVGG